MQVEVISIALHRSAQVYRLPKSRLYATYFEGDSAQGLPPDDEAKSIWMEYLPVDQILPGNTKDNFWEMGDVLIRLTLVAIL